jgi:hypothetical protein
MTSFDGDLGCLYGYPLVDWHYPRPRHRDCIAKPLIRRIIAKVRTIGHPVLLRSDRQFPCRYRRRQKRAGLLAIADRYQRLFCEGIVAGYEPIEGVRVEKNAWQAITT